MTVDVVMQCKKQPIKVKVGNVTVPIYRVNNRERVLFQVADYSSGSRKLISHASEEDARRKAQEIAIKLAAGETAILRMSADDRAVYIRAIELLKPTGKPLELAAAEYAEAFRLLDGRSLLDAVSFFTSRFPKKLQHKMVPDAVEECLAAKKSDGVSQVYHRVLALRLRRFGNDFQVRLTSLTSASLNDWLRSLGCSGRTRNNYKSDIVTFLHFCEGQGYLAKGHIEAEQLASAEELRSEIEIFTPSELAKILTAANSNCNLLVHVLLGAFAGLRSAEIQRQLWQDINLERGFLKVTGSKLGTPANRLVYLPENLKLWLVGLAKKEGPVSSLVRPDSMLRRLGFRAGVPWKHNALRHSFISYRAALTGDIPRTASEAGNSPRVIFQNYRELVSSEESKAWFAIMPSRPSTS